MSVEMTKAYDITATMISAKFVNLEATKPFFLEKRAALKMIIKFVPLY